MAVSPPLVCSCSQADDTGGGSDVFVTQPPLLSSTLYPTANGGDGGTASGASRGTSLVAVDDGIPLPTIAGAPLLYVDLNVVSVSGEMLLQPDVKDWRTEIDRIIDGTSSSACAESTRGGWELKCRPGD